jgi:hypothetical protein
VKLNQIFTFFFPSTGWKYAFFILAFGVFLIQGYSIYSLFTLQEVNSAIIPERKKNDYNLTINDLDILELKKEEEDSLLKGLLEELECQGIYFHPHSPALKAKVVVKKTGKTIEVQHLQQVYVFFDEYGNLDLTKEKIKSPLELTPRIQDKKLNFTSVNHEEIDLPLLAEEKTVKSLKKQFSELKVQSQDLFQIFYGDQQNVVSLVLFDKQITCNEGEWIGFDGNDFCKVWKEGVYSIQVKLLGTQKAMITIVDPSGYGQLVLQQDLKPKEKASIPVVEEPKQVLIRGNDQINGLFLGRRQLVKKGDIFIYEKTKWKKILSLEEFNQLIDYKIQTEILVIEDLYLKNQTVFIQGKVFDKTRWNFSSFNWKIELKKEKKPKESTQPKTVPPSSMEMMEKIDPDDEEIF